MALHNEPAALTHHCTIHAKFNTTYADLGRVRYFLVVPQLDCISKFLLIEIAIHLLRGIMVSQFDDPFSRARIAFAGKEFFTCSSLSLGQSTFCFRVLICSVRISEESGGWCSSSTIRLTSGLVTLIEASYSDDEVTNNITKVTIIQ